MIQSKEDYKFYLEADKIGLMETRKRPRIIGDEVWKFQRALRRCEYILNCKHGLEKKVLWAFAYFNYRRLYWRNGFHIGFNVFGPGLSIAHWGPLYIAGGVAIGENCRIQNMTTIGSANKQPDKKPKIGNNCYIGSCCQIYGDITIADGIAIGANSVVNKSFTEPNITIAGAPAKKVSDKGAGVNITDATGILRTRLGINKN